MPATIYPHKLYQEKRAIEEHSAKCDRCGKFRFKSDLRPYFISGSETRLMICGYCKGSQIEEIYINTANKFGVSITIAKAMDRCLRSSKSAANASNGRKAHTLALNDIIRLWLIQDGICNLSGITMDPEGDDATRPSLDRIDSNGSYVMGNVQLVTTMVNMMKRNYPQSQFVQTCCHIAVHSQSRFA